MRGACVVFVLVLWPSVAAAQDASTWVDRAREAIADTRYDTARADLDRAETATDAGAYAEEIVRTRDLLLRASASRTATWTHGLSMGLFGGAAFAAATSVGFVAWAFALGLGRPPCGPDCVAFLPPDVVLAFGLASGISALALIVVGAWLGIDGAAIESPVVPIVSVSADGFGLGVSGLL